MHGVKLILFSLVRKKQCLFATTPIQIEILCFNKTRRRNEYRKRIKDMESHEDYYRKQERT